MRALNNKPARRKLKQKTVCNLKMIKCIIPWMCIMASCCVSIVTSMVPAVYNVHHSQCGELHHSNTQQLADILEQVKDDIPPPAFVKDCNYIDILFTENPQLKRIYENSTFIVQTFQKQTANECQQLQAQPVSEPIMETLQKIQVKPTNPCTRINRNSPSGYYYFITVSNGSEVQVYCDTEGENCGGEGGWMRVAYVDLTQSGSQCPQGLTRVELQGSNYCGRFNSDMCVSTTFEVYNVTYTQVCGRVSGYQYGSTDGFWNYYDFGQTSIDGYYVDGVSITHGQPRKHVWTYSAAIQSFPSTENYYTCPCFSNNNYSSPSFVGQDYYCESGNDEKFKNGLFYSNDTLWDGKQCEEFEVPCCTHSNMPWFIKTLNQSTSDDIELRVCCREGYPGNEDIPLNLIELYVR